jgi:hypothetical protein
MGTEEIMKLIVSSNLSVNNIIDCSCVSSLKVKTNPINKKTKKTEERIKKKAKVRKK